ncbi:tripartite tricarboxylate transporter TctB family protein [Bradyrhizobium canariense]|uniref:Tripartite tricarboxylate transporter TctB family protein n=1 Tax=Bradyrhizobium canariense TaxID=255045 RepID=A0A1H1SG38_9BRAD|nr:tripartite tricarboxylate transporter TctB family protein [Bradyrhizobium canariense]SDS46974.1 Tripartite tricarboxylate transporter TctB family protein [Bradyrhizobium canariense]
MYSFLNKYNKDYYGGGLMMLIGLAAAIQGRTYNVGTMSKMGSGFFPVALGVLLILAGAMIALTAKAAVPADIKTQVAPEWRGWLCITLGIIAFVVLGRYGGLLPATFAIVFISAMGDRQNTIGQALSLSLVMTAVAVAVFWWALQLQFALFRWG